MTIDMRLVVALARAATGGRTSYIVNSNTEGIRQLRELPQFTSSDFSDLWLVAF